jgi:uncharacterized protein YgbK (DUF1537 family)
LAFIGDDFTGATDALEALALSGLRCALLLKPPRPELLRQFGPLDAVGIATDCRSMSPVEMDERLPEVFESLVALEPRIVHYKVCSTFDSAPHTGSIGQAIRIARATSRFARGPIPIVAGNPALGRYCAFRNLFARASTDARVHRVDRHPMMSVHPITPMDEADLSLHLRKQGVTAMGSLDWLELERSPREVDEAVDRQWSSSVEAVLFDALHADHMAVVGRQLARIATKESRPAFVIGSSGVEYALTQTWRDQASFDPVRFKSWSGVDRVLAVSGSASRMSDMQIADAAASGFEVLAVNARSVVDDSLWPQELASLRQRAVSALQSGRSILIHSARGPDDPRIAEMRDYFRGCGHDPTTARQEGGRVLGVRLGMLTRQILEQVRLRRLLLAGGDTSSQVMQTLGADALTVIARIAPGVPLCRASFTDSPLDGLEVALKGGQLGGPDFFESARAGCAQPAWE